MANLEALISRKTEADTQWKAQRQAERESIVAMQDAGVTEITSNPEAYAIGKPPGKASRLLCVLRPEWSS